MIFKLTFNDGRIDWCTAKNQLHLLKSYDANFDLSLQDIEDLQSITDEEAKEIMIMNIEAYENTSSLEQTEIPLYDLCNGNDFEIIASTEFC